MFAFWRRKVKEQCLTIGSGSTPKIPNGATSILWHTPIGSGEIVLRPEQLRFVPLVRGKSYRWFRENNPELTFADASVLDALLSALLLPSGALNEVAIKEWLGDFRGQLFFLNTAFDTRDGECHAFFNWKTFMPALRYVCPADNLINHDVHCCALVIEK